MLDGWSISKSGDCCTGCGGRFVEHAAFVSCLSEEDLPAGEGDAAPARSELVRHDFCLPCWEGRTGGAVFCHWRSRRVVAEVKPVLDTALMLEFFDRLEDADTEQKRTFRFVLALYLMRRKELKLLEVVRGEEAEKLVFLRRSSGDKAEVANPQMSEEQIQAAAAQFSQLLNAAL